jgi:hypothetical protein
MSDGFVRAVLKPTLVLAMVLLIVPIAAILYCVADVLSNQLESDMTKAIGAGFLAMKGIPATVTGTAMQILPALLTALCFASDKITLSWTGRIVFVLDLILVALSAVAVSILNPDAKWANDFTGNNSGLVQAYKDTAEFCLNTGLVYFGLLTGLTLSTTTARSAATSTGTPTTTAETTKATAPDLPKKTGSTIDVEYEIDSASAEGVPG